MVPLKGTTLHLMPAEQATASSSSTGGTNKARAPSLNCCRAVRSTRGLPPAAGCARHWFQHREAESFGRFGDGVVKRYRVLEGTMRNPLRAGRQPFLHRVNGPGECGGVGAVDLHRVEAVQPQMLVEPFSAALLLHGAALFDAATVEDHERSHEAAVLCTPPARRPVAATLLLESAVAEEYHQPLAGQGHVHVLQFGKAEIAPLGQPPAVFGPTWLPSGEAGCPCASIA
jgi:hypothetical protein